MVQISVRVNGAPYAHDVEPRQLLVHYLRETLGLTGTNIGCDTTSCGACTVLLEGQSVKSCTLLAAQADGTSITTIEGLADADGTLHPVQEAFREHHALQCGYCTPGMVMAVVSLLDEEPELDERRVREGLEGNLCRCTGYHNIVQAVLDCARQRGKLVEADGVIPAAFDYVRPTSVEEAIAALTEHGDDAKLLAGGHSLLPLMKLRLATPSVVVDVGRIPGLSYIEARGDEIAIGALTRHHDLETSALLHEQVPLLAHTAHQVGDPQVRHRGTLGGTIAHGDPASDLPATVLALGGTLVAQSPRGRREIAATEFFQGFLETALAPDEMLVEVRVPTVPGVGWGFQKFNRRAQDWAIVGVSAIGGDSPGVALVNMGPTPRRAPAVEAALRAGAAPADAAEHAPDGTEPPSDLNATPDYRRHLATVLVRRALESVAASNGS